MFGILLSGLNVTAVTLIFVVPFLRTEKGSWIGAAWALVSCFFLAFLLTFLFKPQYKRLEYERQKEQEIEMSIVELKVDGETNLAHTHSEVTVETPLKSFIK